MPFRRNSMVFLKFYYKYIVPNGTFNFPNSFLEALKTAGV